MGLFVGVSLFVRVLKSKPTWVLRPTESIEVFVYGAPQLRAHNIPVLPLYHRLAFLFSFLA